MWVLASRADVEHEWALHGERVVLGRPRQQPRAGGGASRHRTSGWDTVDEGHESGFVR